MTTGPLEWFHIQWGTWISDTSGEAFTSMSSNSYRMASLHIASTQFGSCARQMVRAPGASDYLTRNISPSVRAIIMGSQGKSEQHDHGARHGGRGDPRTFLRAALKIRSASRGSPSPHRAHPSATSLLTSSSSRTPLSLPSPSPPPRRLNLMGTCTLARSMGKATSEDLLAVSWLSPPSAAVCCLRL